MDRTYTLLELAEATGASARTIRYYIAQGLLPGPVTQGCKAHYTGAHADRLQEIRRLQGEGWSLAQIKARFSPPDPIPQPVPVPEEGWVVFPVDDTLYVAVRATAPSPRQRLARALAEVGRVAVGQGMDQTTEEPHA
ncbi:MAG TPA: helix-turn-helix domain-containing protein [Myxococcota bacterium]|nr:helix-turn-helix domain-containing protein [Myxococcota bacterium]HQK51343.1 helix-turn-helix domain-containing protein [Myxococcota bacterium]